MDNICIALLVGLIAMVTSGVVFPWALKFAKQHGVVDNPNARKLQRVPVPVFGGVVVYSGILVGGTILMLLMPEPTIILEWVAVTIMLLIGTWDDIKDLSASLKFAVEIILVTAFIEATGIYIDDFHGLWGIHELSSWIGIPLSVFAGVGLINAVNLIDGVDGYSSGYGMLACSCFAIAFWNVWSPVMVCLDIIVIGALVPFFMHNVFGQRSRMFIGDGGTLMLGMIMVVMVFYSMSCKGRMETMEVLNLSIPAFLIAVLCIPVFDTLRVMTMRILRGKSPFKPDKTHLHHLFIDMGFSHLGSAIFILMINSMVVLIWFMSWKLGASVDVQTYIVIVLGFLVTFGFYKFMKVQQNGGPLDEEGYPQGTTLWHLMCKLGDSTHKEDKHYWKIVQNIMDGPMLGNSIVPLEDK